MPWNIRLLVALTIAGLIGVQGMVLINWAGVLVRRFSHRAGLGRTSSRFRQVGPWLLRLYMLLWVFGFGSIVFGENLHPVLGGVVALVGVIVLGGVPLVILYWLPSARAKREIRRAAMSSYVVPDLASTG